MATVIGTVTSVQGMAIVVDANGNRHMLQVGEVLHAGDKVITASGASVSVKLANGETVNFAEAQTVKITDNLAQVDVSDVTENAVNQAVFDAVLTALNEGRDITEVLDAPAAGEGGSDGNASFVNLDRISESVTGAAYDGGNGFVETAQFSLLPNYQYFPEDPTIDFVTPSNPLPNSDQVIEGNSMVFTVGLSTPTQAPATYTFSLGGGTASTADYGTPVFSNGVTYNPVTGTITVPAGVSSFTVTVPTVDDTIVELNETLPISVGGVEAIGTIVDNDRATVVTVEPGQPGTGDDSVIEGASLVYTVTLSDPTNAPTTYTFNLGGGSASNADFGAPVFSNGVVRNPNGTITVPTGVTSFTVTVPTVDDDAVEPNETVPLTIGGATGTGTIIDNDRATVDTVTAGPNGGSVVEGNDLVYTVTLSDTTNAPTTYSFTLGGGTASGADYVTPPTFSNGVTYNSTNNTITVPAGVKDFTVTVPTVDDTLVEPNETLNLNVGGKQATGTIVDNDRATVVTVEPGTPDPNDNSVIEGNNLVYTVTLSDRTNAPTTYTFNLGGGTASTSDYGNPTFSNGVTRNADGSITVPAGVTSFTVTVPTVDDTIVEPNETVPLTIGGATGTGIIVDNDRATVDTVTAGPNGGTVVEGNNLVYTVTLSATTNAETTYSFTLGGGTASAADYVTPPTFSNGVTYNAANNTITVPAGVKDFTVTVPTVDDTIVEPNETLPIKVGGVTAIGTIVDNDRATVDTVTAGPNGGSVVEGNNLVYTVTLSAETNASTTYSFTLGGGTASAADYVTPPTFSNGVTYNATNNTITVPPGVTSFTVTVTTVDDTLVESNETLPINVGGKTATGIIIDNDGGITTVNGSKFAVSEEGLAGGIKDNTGSSDTTDSAEATGAFSLNGSSAGAVWTLTAPTTPLTSGGVTVTWTLSADGKTLTGSAGNEKVLTVTINDSGEYKVVLSGQVDHPVANVEDTVLANVGVKVVVNGVTQTTTLPVTIEDDAPVANGGSVTVTNENTANVAPVAAIANTGNLLGLVGLSALNLIDLSTRSAFGATDANNNISKVELNYQSLISLGGRQFTVSQALAAELGLKVVITNDPGFLTLIGPSSHVVITALDGGTIDNLAVNELLATARLSGGAIGAEVLNGTSITVTDSQGASSSAALSTLVDATVLSNATANPNLKEGDGNGNTLTGTGNDDQIYGYGGNDTLNGGAGNDILRGGSGNDTLDGGIGNDILVGGSGNDSLTGGAGRDIFRWEKGDAGTAGTPAVDTVTDFTLNADVIDLRSVLQGESLANLSNYVRVTVENGNTVLHISSTGGFSSGFSTAAENQTIVLQGVNLQTAYGTTDSAQILTNLVNSGNLAIDPAAATASGSLGAFGADGGHVQSVVVGGVTYTYNATNNTVSASGNSPAVTGYGYNANSHQLTVTTAKGETITVNVETGAYLYNGSRPLVAGETTSVGFTLIDNDGDTSTSSLQFNGTGQPTITTVEPGQPGTGDDSVVEGASLVYTVTLSTAPNAPATYAYNLGGGTASTADYGTAVFSNGVVLNPNGTITVPAGVTSFTVTVPTVDDLIVESNETLPLTIGGATGTGIIVDNDRATVDTVTAGPAGGSVVEGNNLVYTVTLSATTNAPTTYSFTLGGGTASAADYVTPPTFSNGVTYNAANNTITVPAGVKDFTVTVPTVDDTIVESNETLPLNVGGVVAVGTIVDNDRATVVTVEPGQPGTGDDSVVEGTSLVYTVTLSATTNAPTTYNYSLGGGTASTADYGTAVFSNGVTYNAATGTITVPTGVSSFTVTVPTVDDTLVELNETLPLTIGGATGTGVIVDNDRATVVTVEPGQPGTGDDSVVEGNNLVYTVTLSATTNAPTTYAYSLGGGSASAADYGTAVFSNGVTYNAATGTITVPAGVSSFTVTVPTVDDTLVELNETLPLTIGGATGTGVIVDNDKATVVTVEPGQPGTGDDSVVEGTSLVYTVTLSATTNVPTTYTYTLGGGSASTADYGTAVFSNGVTYNAVTGTITVPAGVSSFTVTVPTVDDTLVELNETLPLTIGGATGTGIIVDNDKATVVTVEPGQPGTGDDSVVEGNNLVYTVTLSATTNVPTTYTYTLGGGSASAADYGTAVFSNGVTYNAVAGTITVPAGVSSFTVTVPTVDDTLVELNETLPLTIGGATGTGIIVDNDRATIDTITAGPTGGSVVEGNNLVYTVTLSTTTNAPTTYSYNLGGGTASTADYGSAVFSNGVTYNAVNGTITVPAGVSSFTVTVPTIDDTLIEQNETLPLSIGGKSATGIIIDNDSGITVVNGSKFTVSEEGLSGGIKDTAGNTDTTDSAVATGSFSLNASNSSGAVWTLTAPTAGTLTSGGVTVTWSLSADGKTLTGFAGTEKVLTATINNSGAYNVTLSKPIDHPNTTTEDTLKTEIGVKVVANGVTQVTTLPVTIEDDSPVANNQTVYATNSANTNVMITLDVSGSMAGRDGVGGQTRLASAIQSIKTLLASYDDLGDVKVALVVFAGDAQTRQLGTTWLTVAEANALLNTLSANGNTNYDSALETAINAYGSPGKLDNAQTVSYFFTDGEPNRGLGGTSDLSGNENASSADAGIQAAEERAWIQFLETYNIKSYALGLGQNTSTTQLDPIAYDGQAGVNTGGVKVTNFDQLDGVLSETVAASISGSLVTNGGFGADGGYVKSVAVDGSTYTFNATTGAITVNGTNNSTYDSASHKLTITTTKGSLVLDLDDGTFVFTPKNTSVSGVADFKYTLSDRDGDTSSATLSINVTKINAVPQVAPEVSTGVNSAGLLTIPGLLNVDLLNFSSRQGFSASDVNNNINNVTITYSALIALSGAFLNYSSAVASELGLKVTYAQDNGFLGLLGGSGKLEVTALDGGTIDNLKLNEFLSTIRTDNTIGVNVLDSFKISATDSTHLSDSASSANLINIDLLTSGNSGIISGTSGNDTQLNGTSGNDIIYGLGGNDTLNGGAGNDILRGGAGNDTLNGGEGNDILIGGKGNDTLTGGAGVDVFKWDRGDDGVAGNPARDTITDFNKATPSQGGDVLDIRDLLQGENPSNLQNYLHFEKSGSDTIVHISSNGGFANDAHNVSGSFSSGNTTQQIVLNGVDITTGQSSDAAIINSLLAQQKLIVDQ
jgi:T1SS-143 domain-containing protein